MTHRYSIQEFINQSRQDESARDFFQLESPHMLEVNLEGQVWTKMGSMVAYVGDIRFEREGVMEQGFTKFLKKAVTGEGAKLTKAQGKGRLYLADEGKNVQILALQNEAIFVNGNDLLAFEPSIQWDIKIMKKVSAMLAGGLFNVRLEGTGLIAVTTHHRPLALVVEPGQVVRTDPNATVAWSGGLSPEFHIDAQLKSFFGRGSGESVQMEFKGSGFVVIQPYEEQSFQSQASGGG